MRLDRIYIAGALNADAPGYIRNMHQMIKKGNTVRKMGAAPYIPGLDFLLGLVDGEMSYEDYFDTTTEYLLSSDAVCLVPGWENSDGVKRELEMAKENSIPVLKEHRDIFNFIHRSKILCVVGESGTGKSELVNWIQETMNIPMIESYTTRKRRSPNETGHTFVSDEKFDSLRKEDMLAYTKFGDNRYCCLHSDVEKQSTYVIDEHGYSMLRHNHKDKYKIAGVRVYRDAYKRGVNQERLDRDEGRFDFHKKEFDYVISNNGTIQEFRKKINVIAKDFFKG